MTVTRTLLTSGSALLAVAPLAVLGVATPAAADPVHPSQVVLDWERTAFRTIYGTTPIPVGVPILGFTSVSMYDAVRDSIRLPRSSEVAAAAVAAHDVLLQYYPAAADALGADLATSLARVPAGPAKTRGMAVGERAADDMIASRVGDGWGDPSVVYSKPALPGYWQPPSSPPPGNMLAPWLGFLDPLVLDELVLPDGPDPLDSAAYTADYNEVRDYGGTTSLRSQDQTDTAVFFNSNSAIMVGQALVARLEREPVGLRRTARVFAVMHGAMTDSLITCWFLKYDEGFWRPFQAIPGAGNDGNDDTEPDPGWTPLLPQPPYPDYVSGHGSLTAPAIEAIRMEFGEDFGLVLRSSSLGQDWEYDTLGAIERDAFHARIWGGFHFRDAMDDAYWMGHETARRVRARLG